jgi:hypothetical protein
VGEHRELGILMCPDAVASALPWINVIIYISVYMKRLSRAGVLRVARAGLVR